MPPPDFAAAFHALTGNDPFPWQHALYERFCAGDFPAACTLPTGLGKTSVVAVWLLTLAENPGAVPRRLVYVVNRRTVVDQTTDEVVKYRKRLDENPELAQVVSALRELCADPTGMPLALSTLRGQFADNREWSADPARPAVVVGTVDMIGSRLLFSGYGCGFKTRPLHAGFLCQDALLVHDEAHLEPAFQELVLAIEREQEREREGRPSLGWPQLRVMELTATPRGGTNVFELTPEEKSPPADPSAIPKAPIHEVWRRTHAKKTLALHGVGDEKKELVPAVVRLALRYKDGTAEPAVVVFVRTVEGVGEVVKGLKAGKVLDDSILTLTGTVRGYERDRMATSDGVFARFKKDSPAATRPGTVYLVCTSAGEVGVDISADRLVCDLSTFESMAQRFGRVNRYGTCAGTEVHVVHPVGFEDDEYDQRRGRTLALLRLLGDDASPAALGDLNPADRLAAFAPAPPILPTSDILFDSWALTTVTGKLPGRPAVEPYLHGLPTDRQPPETSVAWREEVERLDARPWNEWKPKEFNRYAASLLDAYPLKPHELLREPSHRAFKQFEAMAKRFGDRTVPVWLVGEDGEVERLTLAALADRDARDRIEWKTVLLPPSAGGLENGMLAGGAAPPADGPLDVADELYGKNDGGSRFRRRKRLLNADPASDPDVKDMHPVQRIAFPGSGEDEDAPGDEWVWYALGNEGDPAARKPVRWDVHVGDVTERAEKIVAHLPLNAELKKAVVFAARYHDHGKRRKVFQTVLGNRDYPGRVLAKSGKAGGRIAETYRHEFGSLLDVEREPAFAALDADAKDLVLQLIAAHHGRGRPHFPRGPDADEAFDPDATAADADRVAAAVPQRFARLQRKYGRWGLAYLESLLRAADWAASANPSSFEEGQP